MLPLSQLTAILKKGTNVNKLVVMPNKNEKETAYQAEMREKCKQMLLSYKNAAILLEMIKNN